MNKFRSLLLFYSFTLLLFLGSLVFSQSALAFSTPDGADYEDIYNKAVYGTEEMNLQSFVHEVVKALEMSGVKQGAGCLSGCKPGSSPVTDSGFAGMLASGIGSIYTSKPASGVEYLADIGSRLNIVKPAYAQGFGFTRMSFVLPAWKAFRDLTYLLFVLVFVVTGFAIMFRFKIDPRTVITLESALPKIIIGLILVTFSYAIAGFMVDIMWLLNNIILQVFKGIMPRFDLIPVAPVTSEAGVLLMIIYPTLAPILIGALILLILGLVGGVAAALAAASGVLTVTATPIAFIAAGALVVLVIYVVAGVISLLMLFVSLLKAYTNIIVAIIFGPFQLLAGTLPGGNMGSWFTNLIANLAVLPVTLVMVYVAGMLVNLNGFPKLAGYVNGTEQWSSVLAEVSVNPDLKSQLFTTLLMCFVSIMIIFMTPKASDMIKNALAGKSIGDRIGVGEALGQSGGLTTPALLDKGVNKGFIPSTAQRGVQDFASGLWKRFS